MWSLFLGASLPLVIMWPGRYARTFVALRTQAPTATSRSYTIQRGSEPVYCQPKLLLGGSSAQVCSRLYVEKPNKHRIYWLLRIVERGPSPSP